MEEVRLERIWVDLPCLIAGIIGERAYGIRLFGWLFIEDA